MQSFSDALCMTISGSKGFYSDRNVVSGVCLLFQTIQRVFSVFFFIIISLTKRFYLGMFFFHRHCILSSVPPPTNPFLNRPFCFPDCYYNCSGKSRETSIFRKRVIIHSSFTIEKIW